MLTKASAVKVKDEQELATLAGRDGMSGLLPVVKLQNPILKLVR